MGGGVTVVASAGFVKDKSAAGCRAYRPQGEMMSMSLPPRTSFRVDYVFFFFSMFGRVLVRNEKR